MPRPHIQGLWSGVTDGKLTDSKWRKGQDLAHKCSWREGEMWENADFECFLSSMGTLYYPECPGVINTKSMMRDDPPGADENTDENKLFYLHKFSSDGEMMWAF